MAFSRENIARVRAEYTDRRRMAAEEAQQRKNALHAEIPALRALDREISSVGIRVMQKALAGGDVQSEVARMKEEHGALRARRAQLLQQYGYPADYTDIRYRCEACLDTGFRGVNMCSCMRRELILAGYESSGLGRLMQSQSFESFSLQYYTGKERSDMEVNLRTLRDFAENFSERRGTNFLLAGPTGLGKTHLSTAAAKTVIDAGYDVLYDTAQGMFTSFENARFRRGGEEEGEREEHCMQCDLLIVDDLGTEMTNTFTLACLYNVINTRLNNGLSTVINTNLSFTELRSRYADRITSRLFGEFRLLVFSGRDIRAQKLK